MAQVGSERAFDGSLSSCKEEEPNNNGRSAADAGPTRAMAKNPAPKRAAIVAFPSLLRNMLQKLMGFNSDRGATARTAEEENEGCEATGGRFCAGFRREIVVEGGQSKVGVDAMVETSKDDRGTKAQLLG